jgi:hypothetical protein
MDWSHLLASPPTCLPWEVGRLSDLLPAATGAVVFGRGTRLGVDIVVAGRVVRMSLPDAAALATFERAAAVCDLPVAPSLGRLIARLPSKVFGLPRPDAFDGVDPHRGTEP